ncbi:hypothetical protein QR680_015822 [Steinernema hermaphroditum]|uniref:Uncharacterized protein n=1 Tax=Steinernema hermaphroditum TaxID=289476 RepID=A0AA39H927_9BILA|nr:hypothetical protein QR680_015822 [Steinernema hermaphroditum]
MHPLLMFLQMEKSIIITEDLTSTQMDLERSPARNKPILKRRKAVESPPAIIWIAHDDTASGEADGASDVSGLGECGATMGKKRDVFDLSSYSTSSVLFCNTAVCTTCLPVLVYISTRQVEA